MKHKIDRAALYEESIMSLFEDKGLWLNFLWLPATELPIFGSIKN